MGKLNSHRNHDRCGSKIWSCAQNLCVTLDPDPTVAFDPLLVSGALWLIAIFLANAGGGHPGEGSLWDAARDEEQGATWPNQVVVRFAEMEELGVRQYFSISQDRNENLISRVQARREPAVVPL
ncbi:hypothetical protein R1flu_028890 [Riccia fluitans]|uniref:Uncharacterized protein n=1 Tax=Riccia fluitans TaxID=41844 RepID=A0ABD1XN25_9MARC